MFYRVIIVVCDTSRYWNPPIVCKVLTSNACALYYIRNIPTLRLCIPIPNNYIAFLNKYKSRGATLPCAELNNSSNVHVLDDEKEEDIIIDDTESISSKCLRNLVHRLGDAIIVDEYSDCGYSVVYPDQANMEKDQAASECSPFPTNSIGTQYGGCLKELEEYKVAFEFAKNHGYGLVEFVDVTHGSGRPSSRKRRRRAGTSSIKDCMYSTLHHMPKETFSLQYQSKIKNSLNHSGKRYCSSFSSKGADSFRNIKQEIDIVQKIRETIAQMDEYDNDDVGADDTNTVEASQENLKPAPRFSPSVENAYLERIKERYGLQSTNRGGTGDNVGSVDTNHALADRLHGSGVAVDGDEAKTDDQSTTCDITFCSLNESENHKPVSIQDNSNDIMTSSNTSSDNFNIADGNGDQLHLQEIDDTVEQEEDGESDKNDLQTSKKKRKSFLGRIRSLLHLKPSRSTSETSVSCLCTRAPSNERQRSSKVEKVKILQVTYNPTDVCKTTESQNASKPNEEVKEETAFSLNSGLIQFRPVDETEKRLSNPPRCRPKPKALRNSNVGRLLERLGSRRKQTFSTTSLTTENCTNSTKGKIAGLTADDNSTRLTKDKNESLTKGKGTNLTDKIQSTISVVKYHDATSGDFIRHDAEEFQNEAHIPDAIVRANAHGDVMAVPVVDKDASLISQQPLGNVKISYGVWPSGNAYYEPYKSQNVGDILTQLNEESEKNNNKSEPTVEPVPSSECCNSINIGDSTSYDNGVAAVSDSIVHTQKENPNQCIRKETENTNNEDNSITGRRWMNCNTNANDKENENELYNNSDTDESRRNLVVEEEAEIDTFQNIEHRYNPIMRQSRAVYTLPTGDPDEHKQSLDDALTSLVREQDTNNAGLSASSSNTLRITDARDKDAFFKRNCGNKMTRKDRGRLTSGRTYSPHSPDSSARSYVLSSPGRSEVKASNPDHRVVSVVSPVVSDCDLGEQQLGGSHADDQFMDCPDSLFPPINMHQKNMVFCPTTENYWTPSTSFPRLTTTNVGGLRHNNDDDDHTTHNRTTMCMGMGSMSGSDHNIHAIHADNEGGNHNLCEDVTIPMDIFRIVDSCLIESEKKLSQRLQNLHESVNKRLAALEALVNRKFDTALTLIENLKKLNGNKSMNKIDKENRRHSESIHLNTEAAKTKSVGSNAFSGNKRETIIHNNDRELDDAANRTTSTVSFPIPRHLLQWETQKNCDDAEENSSPTTAHKTRQKDRSRNKRKRSVTKTRKTRKGRKHSRLKKYSIRKKQNATRKRRPYKRIKDTPKPISRKCEKTQYYVLRNKHVRTRSPQRSSDVDDRYYLRRKHSRKCRLRRHLAGDTGCVLCMLSAKRHGTGGGGKGNRAKTQKAVHWPANEILKEGNHSEYRRSPHPRVARIVNNAQRRNNRCADNGDKHNNGGARTGCKQRRSTSKSVSSKSRRGKEDSKRKRKSSKKIVRWAEIVGKKDRTGKQYRRSPHARNVMKRPKAISVKSLPSGNKKPKAKSSPDETSVQKTGFLDKSNCSTRENVIKKSFRDKSNCSTREKAIKKSFRDKSNRMEPNSSYARYHRAYRQLVRENHGLLKEIEVMKRSLPGKSKDVSVVKKEVVGKFNRLMATCSGQRAHDLHRILFAKEKTTPPPHHKQSSSIDDPPTRSGEEFEIVDEKNNNKSLVESSHAVIFNAHSTTRNGRENTTLYNRSLVRSGVLQHVDSFELIPKGLDRKKKPSIVYTAAGPFLKLSQRRFCASVDAHASDDSQRQTCSSSQVDDANFNPQCKDDLKHGDEKRMKTNYNYKANSTKAKDKLNLVAGEVVNGIKWKDCGNEREIIGNHPPTKEIGTITLDTSMTDHINNGVSPTQDVSCCSRDTCLEMNKNIGIDSSLPFSWSTPIPVTVADELNFTHLSNGNNTACQSSNDEFDEFAAFESCVNTHHNIEKLHTVPQQQTKTAPKSTAESMEESETRAKNTPTPERVSSLNRYPRVEDICHATSQCESPFRDSVHKNNNEITDKEVGDQTLISQDTNNGSLMPSAAAIHHRSDTGGFGDNSLMTLIKKLPVLVLRPETTTTTTANTTTANTTTANTTTANTTTANTTIADNSTPSRLDGLESVESGGGRTSATAQTSTSGLGLLMPRPSKDQDTTNLRPPSPHNNITESQSPRRDEESPQHGQHNNNQSGILVPGDSSFGNRDYNKSVPIPVKESRLEDDEYRGGEHSRMETSTLQVQEQQPSQTESSGIGLMTTSASPKQNDVNRTTEENVRGELSDDNKVTRPIGTTISISDLAGAHSTNYNSVPTTANININSRDQQKRENEIGPHFTHLTEDARDSAKCLLLPTTTRSDEKDCIPESNNLMAELRNNHHHQSMAHECGLPKGEQQGITRHPYLDVRTPGLSTSHPCEKYETSSSADNQNTSYTIRDAEQEHNKPTSHDETSTAIGDENNDAVSSENVNAAKTESSSDLHGDVNVNVNVMLDGEMMMSQTHSADDDCPNCSSYQCGGVQEEPSSTTSEINNNNVTTDCLVCLPHHHLHHHDHHHDHRHHHNHHQRHDLEGTGTVNVFAHHKRLCSNSTTNCQYSPPVQKQHCGNGNNSGCCQCSICPPRVKSMTSLPLQISPAVGAVEGGRNQGHVLLDRVWPKEREVRGHCANPRKRPFDGNPDEEGISSKSKYRRKQGRLSQSRVHFRRVRWQLRREAQFRKHCDATKRQRHIAHTFIMTSLDPTQRLSPDADSESSL